MELDLFPCGHRACHAVVALVVDAGDAFLRFETLDHRKA